MFSFFRRFATSTAAGQSAPQPKRMTLEERQAYRKEMLYQGVREAFLSMEVVSSMYKFKVMAVDERHHRFIVMIDVAKSFVTGKTRRTDSFAALESSIRDSTFRRFGVMVEGTYWRVSETESQFERKVRASDPLGTTPETVQKMEVSGVVYTPDEPVALARASYHPVSEEEAEAFMAALRAGQQLPPIQVGEREYHSDLAPLDGGIMIGGTQYGRL